MSDNPMKILVVEPMKRPYVQEIDGSLESMQKLVGGTIQAVYPFPEDAVALICNDEGKLLNLPYNRFLYDEQKQPYDVICGTFFVGKLQIPDHPADPHIQRYVQPGVYPPGAEKGEP